jgi:hypothetical protein
MLSIMGEAPWSRGKPLGKEILAEGVEGAENLERGAWVINPPFLLEKTDLLHNEVKRERLVI